MFTSAYDKPLKVNEFLAIAVANKFIPFECGGPGVNACVS